MKFYKYSVLALSLCGSAYAQEATKIRVDHSNGPPIISISFPWTGESSPAYQEVWRSENEAYCKFGIFNKSANGGVFDCYTGTGYWSQIPIDCAVNTSRENAAYLFFGKYGSEKNSRDFYVWCE